MSHQLCQNCGSNRFEDIDGRSYCVVCQFQNIALQSHVSFANEGNAQLGRRVRDQVQTTATSDGSIFKMEGNEPMSQQTDDTISRLRELNVDDDDPSLLNQPLWSSFEVYSDILNVQVKAILQLNYIPKDKEKEFLECTFLLYLRYLSANGILDTVQQRSLNKQEERRLKTNLLSKTVYLDRANLFAKTRTRVLKKKLCIINLDILIGLIHCAGMLINCPITIKQLIEWINTDKLPYYNIIQHIPKWMRPTGRDRFNLEKMNIHPGTLFFYYNNHVQPVVKSYLFQSSSYSYQILLHLCQIFCQQVYFPFDDDTRPLFQSLCTIIVQTKSSGRRFLCTSLDMELSVLVILIIIILLRSINDHLLDEFVQNIFREKLALFSYAVWLRNLNALIALKSRRYNQFFGRSSVLEATITDNNSKINYMKSLSKTFERTIQLQHEKAMEDIQRQENDIQQVLLNNSKSGSLIYVMKTKEFFHEVFHQIPSESLPLFFESLVNRHSPLHFSIVDKSELYETFLSLIRGATINQIENFYLLDQRFDWATSSNFLLTHLISTLTKYSSIPYDQDFYSFFSRFLRTFAFLDQHLHHYFYRSTFTKRHNSKDQAEEIGMKKYGIDQLPIAYDLKFEQERARNTERRETSH